MSSEDKALQHGMPNPGGMILRPDYVKGYLPTAQRAPDRLFYLLDPFRDLVWEVDGYRHPAAEGGTPYWILVLTCPTCRNHLILDTSKKKVEIDKEGIQSEEFRCSHPAEFGGVCPFAVALDRPRSQEQREVCVQGRKYRIDAVVKRA